MGAVNHRVGAFMGKITASPNSDSDKEKVGFVNRMFALNQRSRERNRAFKRRHPKLFRGLKYAGMLVLIWLVFLAPWPLVR
jgi:beta-hydroxylase